MSEISYPPSYRSRRSSSSSGSSKSKSSRKETLSDISSTSSGSSGTYRGFHDPRYGRQFTVGNVVNGRAVFGSQRNNRGDTSIGRYHGGNDQSGSASIWYQVTTSHTNSAGETDTWYQSGDFELPRGHSLLGPAAFAINEHGPEIYFGDHYHPSNGYRDGSSLLRPRIIDVAPRNTDMGPRIIDVRPLPAQNFRLEECFDGEIQVEEYDSEAEAFEHSSVLSGSSRHTAASNYPRGSRTSGFEHEKRRRLVEYLRGVQDL